MSVNKVFSIASSIKRHSKRVLRSLIERNVVVTCQIYFSAPKIVLFTKMTLQMSV